MKSLTKTDSNVLTKEATEESYRIVLFNDDFNTFPHVIECLIRYCKHESIQAEQCALIVHHSGKCSVKEGDYLKLEPICSALLEKGLNAEIQQ